ncbi:Thiol-disulfide oxidoreductase ResA [Aquisphaera giovannonii]|uniref:Thiol-disulfide oxidoreductase ResA n=1 Tax=Aquisphaera giovannonii TaxID=406548 RepID=A0A5B9W785_9BACT|nr:TlpA disulfide reductase family protein [Aquisphaera giovannonii]QEH36438.1 Thiol-disulfide oxidoreductase ResA [Aquisphaera giovannonii]
MKTAIVACSIGLVSFGLLLASHPGVSADEGAAAPGSGVKLERLKWDAFRERLASAKSSRLTLVDAWATTCGPCKANFPHLVEMHKKYGSKGLNVVSVTLDDPTDEKAVAAAEKFLKEKEAVFTNVLLDENFGDGFDKLDINAIPAVFLFGPDGKELKRFTMDDPDHQFTYEDVEREVAARLGSK